MSEYECRYFWDSCEPMGGIKCIQITDGSITAIDLSHVKFTVADIREGPTFTQTIQMTFESHEQRTFNEYLDRVLYCSGINRIK